MIREIVFGQSLFFRFDRVNQTQYGMLTSVPGNGERKPDQKKKRNEGLICRKCRKESLGQHSAQTGN